MRPPDATGVMGQWEKYTPISIQQIAGPDCSDGDPQTGGSGGVIDPPINQT